MGKTKKRWVVVGNNRTIIEMTDGTQGIATMIYTRRTLRAAQADARLIAAAPELLEALEELTQWLAERGTLRIKEDDGHGGDIYDFTPTLSSAYQRAIAAIAQVENE